MMLSVVFAVAATAVAAPARTSASAEAPPRWTVLPLTKGEMVIGINPAGAWTTQGRILGYDGKSTQARGAGFESPRLTSLADGVLIADAEEVKCRGRDKEPCVAGRLRRFSNDGRTVWKAVLPASSFTVASTSANGGVSAGGKLSGCATAGSGAKVCRDLALAHKHGMCTDDEDDDTCSQPLVVQYDRAGQFQDWRTFPGMPGQVAVGRDREVGFYGEFFQQVDLGARARFVSPGKDDIQQSFVRVSGRPGHKTWSRALLGRRSSHVSNVAFDDDGSVWIVADGGQVANGQLATLTLAGENDDRVLTSEPCRTAVVVRVDADGRYLTHRAVCSRDAGGNVWSFPDAGVVIAGPAFSEVANGEPLTTHAGAHPGDTRRATVTWVRQGRAFWSAAVEDAAVRGVSADASGRLCLALMFDGARAFRGPEQPLVIGRAGVWTTVAGCLQVPAGAGKAQN
jgi:hypothetical protein